MRIGFLPHLEFQVKPLLDSSTMQYGGFTRRIRIEYSICDKIVKIDKIVDTGITNPLYFSGFFGMYIAN
jgi:hypothetical protein